MTKADLEKLKFLKQEAKQLEEELRNLPIVSDTVKGSMDTFPYIERTFKIFGVDEKRGARLRAKLNATLAALQSQILMMETWLDTIGDPEMRVILRLKYRNGMTNEQVAEEFGYSEKTIGRKLKTFWEVVL